MHIESPYFSKRLHTSFSTDEISTTTKERATQKLNDEGVNSGIFHQDLPPPQINNTVADNETITAIIDSSKL